MARIQHMRKELISGLQKEISYRTSRSSGPGGQHANKVSTRVELLFDVMGSAVLSSNQKNKLLASCPNRISQEGILQLSCDETRSQYMNKELVWQRFVDLLTEAFKPVKKRRPTKPGKAAVERRLKDKKKTAGKKDARRFEED